jgi:alpha-tubulin suppressor-like RCC1 family protein
MFVKRDGFALPTILIASVVMLGVLITAVSATTSIRSGLDDQYYTQLAREAAESGIARATGCLRDGGYVPQWGASPLRPNTTCSGGTACTNTATCFVTQNGNVRTTFTVPEPVNESVFQLLTAEGKVELLRSSTGQPWRTYTYSANARVGVDLSLTTVAFGYGGSYGAYFATIASDGEMRAVGDNTFGQLGNGSYADTLTPTKFNLPTNVRATAIFTNFVSGGYSMFVLANDSKIYGAGTNGYGQLGDGTTTTRPQPVVYGLPGGRTGRFVAVGGYSSYVLTTDNNIYAAGNCDRGAIGSSYTISGCVDVKTPVRVALPSVTSDLNTVPTSNIVTDYLSAYVRMQGGAVYGWGANDSGQLVNGPTKPDSSVPIKIGTYGDPGQPKAVSVAFDGITVYIVDDQGGVRAAGSNVYGQLGGEKIPIAHTSTGTCLDNKQGDGLTIQYYACAAAGVNVNQQWTFRDDGSIYLPSVNKCIDNKGSDGVNIQLYTCNGTAAQKFVFRDDSTIYNANKDRCLDNYYNEGTIRLSVCNGSNAHKFNLPSSTALRDFALPAGAGTPIKIATDQWFVSVLTDTGEVWSTGINNVGQLGNGKTNSYQPYPVKFILPAGVTGVDINNSAFTPAADPRFSNTFVVGSDGKVYGAGSNSFGQLGDGSTTNRSTPVAMQTINGTSVKASQVVSGNGTTVILTTAGKVYTVGNNENGQLGDGTTTNSSVPKANRYTNVLPITVF